MLTTANAGEDAEWQKLSLVAGSDEQWCSHFGRQFGKFLLNILFVYKPAIMCLHSYQNELNIYVYTETCTQMFLAALSTTAPNWKQP